MMGGNGMGWGWDMGVGFGMGFGWIVPLLVIGLIVWAIVSVTRSRGGGTAPKEAEDSALAILRERYAKGELDEETFRKMRKELEA